MTDALPPLRTAAIAVASLALGLVLASRSPTEAQSDGPSLPANCSSGEIVVSDGFDRFRCVDLDELELDGCSSGDLVTVGFGGALECGRPSSCSSGGLLALDAFGDARCVSALPDCPRGAALVSEGGGRWTCGER